MMWSRKGERTQELKQAILSAFSCPEDQVGNLLAGYAESEWRQMSLWLDVSGIALYLLHRVRLTGAEAALPSEILGSLKDRHARNSSRTQSLLQEAAMLCGWFDRAGIPYALLKGITLAPDSVPDISSRSQADLDILIPSDQRDMAVSHVCSVGYRLQVDNRTSLEFRAAGFDSPNLARLYSAQAPRALDLLLTPHNEGKKGLLARRVKRSINGNSIYALGAADILVQQARHLLQHLCSEFTRLSWVLEFRRHILTRWRDSEFWREVAEIAREEENGDLAMAIAFWLARDLFGDLPVDLDLPLQWQAGALPGRVRLWLELYARRVLLSHVPRSKLYALLRQEVPCAAHKRRSTRAILLPRCFPRRVLDRQHGESVMRKLQRMQAEARFFLQRLYFHLCEGLRFGIEASRWKRAIAREGQ